MRTLKFIVDGQLIMRDPFCDFDNLVPGTSGYVRAEFSCSKEWSKCVKVAQFKSMMGREFTPRLLEDGKSCLIPTEALEKKIFRVGLVGKGVDYTITSNFVNVCQNGGKTNGFTS